MPAVCVLPMQVPAKHVQISTGYHYQSGGGPSKNRAWQRIAHMMLATLDGVISVVPQLGIACSAILTTSIAGSGLKLMRLVSRQLSIAMMDRVQGYTLKLSPFSDSLMEVEITMLARSRARLLHLQVVVTADVVGGLNIICSTRVVGVHPPHSLSNYNAVFIHDWWFV